MEYRVRVCPAWPHSKLFVHFTIIWLSPQSKYLSNTAKNCSQKMYSLLTTLYSLPSDFLVSCFLLAVSLSLPLMRSWRSPSDRLAPGPDLASLDLSLSTGFESGGTRVTVDLNREQLV